MILVINTSGNGIELLLDDKYVKIEAEKQAIALPDAVQSLPQARGKVASNSSEGIRWSHPEKKNFKLILSDLVGFSVFVFLQTYRDVHYSYHHLESGK